MLHSSCVLDLPNVGLLASLLLFLIHGLRQEGHSNTTYNFVVILSEVMFMDNASRCTFVLPHLLSGYETSISRCASERGTHGHNSPVPVDPHGKEILRIHKELQQRQVRKSSWKSCY